MEDEFSVIHNFPDESFYQNSNISKEKMNQKLS